ncbi:DEAD/DEAH box helicase [Amycolatopsis deserti]|nr:DEAD/DEAH box helicase [Amycolatopsis deserti]
MAETERARRLLHRVTAGIPENPVTHVADLPAREARHTEWPSWADPRVVDALRSGGVERPWAHQTEAASLAFAGRHVVVSTGTASGKSLCYQLPVLSTLAADDKACALYLSPTKALGADQLRSVSALDIPGVRAASYDGDTPMAERDWVRAHARWVFTNPDMLHRGILAAHSRWARLFRKLSYVVIDECHSYRGVFGSHVALLLRRLQRVARHYGSSPVFILASATTAEPGEFACRLVGADCVPVVEDASPRGARTVALWEPPLMEDHRGEHGAPVRRSAGAEASRILAELVIEGARTLAFVRSRRGAELTALGARRLLSEVDGELPRQVAAYRAGFLPEERRALERALLSGELKGVATTNALELGVDIAGLDAVVLAGYPGTLASFWQQAGRAGRSGDDALVVFVARDDPLDTYLVHHPEAVLERPVEAAVLDPSNPYVLAPQLACAAAELPLTTGELETFGGAAAREVLDRLVADRLLRRRPSGWYWTSRDRPHYEVDIRGSGGEQIAVVEADTSRLLGTVDPGSACTTVHPGAVYLHQGSSYVVDELDLEAGIALVHAEDPEWTTSAREVADIAVLNTQERLDYGGVTVCLGEVAVTSQVVGYLRRRPSGEVLDQVALDLPAQTLETRAVWYTISPELLEARRAPEVAGPPQIAGAPEPGGPSGGSEAGGTREGASFQKARRAGKLSGPSAIAEAREATGAWEAGGPREGTNSQDSRGAGEAVEPSAIAEASEISPPAEIADARETSLPREDTNSQQPHGTGELPGPSAIAEAREATSARETPAARQVSAARKASGGRRATSARVASGVPEAPSEGAGTWEVGGAPGGAGLDPARIPGALHAAEHAAIGLLPLFATCDRWDIGGVSTALHADTGEATVFVHDGHPGGAGFADRGFAAVVPWLAATREAIISCECPAGCPSCVQSPKCGNGNDPLDKAGAVAVLETVLGAVSRHSARHDHGVAQAAAN